MLRTFKFKLYTSQRNKHLRSQIEIAANVYNHCIALHRRYYRRFKKHLTKNHLQKHITRLKKRSKFSHWKKLNSQAIQDVTDRIERSYKKFFQDLKKPDKKTSPPKFRSRHRYQSITFKQTGYKLLARNTVKIKDRYYKYHNSRDVSGTIKTLTLKRDALGDFYLFFVCDVSQEDEQPLAMTGKIAGLDYGLLTFLTDSQGCKHDMPQYFKKSLQKVRKTNVKLSRKKKGSSNRRKAKLALARLHKKIANQRRDTHFKLARKLATTYDHLFFEDLNLQGMKARWGRKTSDYGFASFLEIQRHMCNKLGKRFHQISRWTPTSKPCHSCGWKKQDLTLDVRSWKCEGCGLHHDRDVNAAKNICKVGASTFEVDEVSLVLTSVHR